MELIRGYKEGYIPRLIGIQSLHSPLTVIPVGSCTLWSCIHSFPFHPYTFLLFFYSLSAWRRPNSSFYQNGFLQDNYHCPFMPVDPRVRCAHGPASQRLHPQAAHQTTNNASKKRQSPWDLRRRVHQIWRNSTSNYQRRR